MTQATARIPVVWKTTPKEVVRLLGECSVLLDRSIKLANDLTSAGRWPLREIRVEIYEDPEVTWEYLLLTLVFDCGPEKAEQLWDKYLNATKPIEQKLNEQELDTFIQMIDYEFECNP